VGVRSMSSMLAQNLILMANLAVALWALAYLIKYVRATKGIEKAANAQSEGLSKPALVLRSISRSITQDDVLGKGRRLSAHAEPNAEDQLELENIGNGPALSVHCVITKTGDSADPWRRFAPYIRAAERLPLPILVGNSMRGKQHKMMCSYSSLGGNKYEAVIELGGSDGTEIQEFSFRSERLTESDR
jgi:hypothetical protein